MKKRLILFCVLAVILIELFIRVSWQIPEKTYPLGMHTFDPYSGYRLTPGFIGNFPEYLGGYDISINSQGLRDYEHNYNKSKTRILVLGDTISFGTGLDYNSTFPHLLENKFNSGGYGIEVINTGVNGYQPSQEYAYYQNEGYKYNPDMILIGIALNDILPADPVSNFRDNFEKYNDSDSNPPDSAIKSLVKKTCHSCVYAYYVYSNIGKGMTDKGYLDYLCARWSDNEFEAYSSELKMFNQAVNNTPIVLVIFPYITQLETGNYSPQKNIASLAAMEGIKVIDLAHYMTATPQQYFLKSAGNRVLSKEGSLLASEVIYAELISQGMVKN